MNIPCVLRFRTISKKPGNRDIASCNLGSRGSEVPKNLFVANPTFPTSFNEPLSTLHHSQLIFPLFHIPTKMFSRQAFKCAQPFRQVSAFKNSQLFLLTRDYC